MVHAPTGHPYARCKGVGNGAKGGSTGYVREHRLVMEGVLDRILSPCEHVHHINGDKLDNRVENLQLIDAGTHSSMHWANPRKRPGSPCAGDPCCNCGKLLCKPRRGLCNACYLRAIREHNVSGIWPAWACMFPTATELLSGATIKTMSGDE